MKRNIIIFGVLALCVAALSTAAAYYLYTENQILKDPQKIAEKETNEIISQIGKLIVLPEGETPTVATVTDPAKLKDQVFFLNAKIGDKVIIYTNAKKAILYDPIQNKIIEVAPLNISASK